MQLKYLPEEKLIFGNEIKCYDPRIGLLKGGPYNFNYSKKAEYKIIKCGIIGSSLSIAKLKTFIERVSLGFFAEASTYGNLGFPGLGRKSPLQFSIQFNQNWENKIIDKEIEGILNASEKVSQKNELIKLFEKKIFILSQTEPPLDVIFISIPKQIIKSFKRENIISDNIIFANRNIASTVYEMDGDINFHNIVKILGMKYDVITQIIKPNTLKYKTTEDKVTIAWNLAVSLYYKAGGVPWKFTELEDGVCYVGISFYRDFSQVNISLNTSMAQVFLSTGDSFILRGDTFEWTNDKSDPIPHLDEEQSKNLINKVLDFYFNKKRSYPSRLVIYKTSNFTQEEINGFYSNKGNIQNCDMLSIQDNSKIFLYRQSQYPVMRGTFIKSEDEREGVLYTTGLIPSMKTYPGMRIPKPLYIRQYTQNTELEILYKEILTLTRLDWNTIKFCQKFPVTISFPQKVGKILAERRAREIQIKAHYRYYM
ncbi:hypothetical protein LCGC14_1435780 [marine sediment metagenome]|uniref:Piwi domain-containing protein n=1 Tax=marine sediment metagenome TaxID=412755 RepID=A0A0F9M2R9_9ZZZZ